MKAVDLYGLEDRIEKLKEIVQEPINLDHTDSYVLCDCRAREFIELCQLLWAKKTIETLEAERLFNNVKNEGKE